MRKPLNRRTLIIGAGAAAAVVVAGGATAMRLLGAAPRSADAEAADYVSLLTAVHDDYANGRVVEHAGWILSQHEFDTIGSRQGETETTTPTVG